MALSHGLLALLYDWRYATICLCNSRCDYCWYNAITRSICKVCVFPSPEGAETIRGRLVMEAGTPRATLLAALEKYDATLREAAKEVGAEDDVLRAVFSANG